MLAGGKKKKENIYSKSKPKIFSLNVYLNSSFLFTFAVDIHWPKVKRLIYAKR